ncbi:MAG: sulfurtransferase TusA family protein [Gammaproteobacteria bacterium]
MDQEIIAFELDTSGLNCPLPVLKLRKQLKQLDSGQVIKVIATDPGSVKDFASFCSQTGDELLESKENEGKFIYRIKKG